MLLIINGLPCFEPALRFGGRGGIRLEESVDEVPDEEAGEFADEEEDHGPAGTGLVEAEGDGYDVSDEGDPGGEGEPDTPFVNALLLFLKGFGFYLEPFFNPFPSADPSYPVGDHAAEPVAEGADYQTACRIPRRRQYREVEGVGAEWEYCGCEKGADEEAEETETLEEFHISFVLP